MTGSGLIPSLCSIPKIPMKINLGKTDLRIDMSFAAAVTLTLILDESGVCACALLCCIVHEAGHIICLRLTGERPSSVVLSFYGVKLERGFSCVCGKIDEILIYASGPAANALLSAALFPFGEKTRSAAVISLCVGLFNMLPCRPLDGGNILLFALCRFVEENRAKKICFWISAAVLAPMAAAGVAVLLKNGNFTLLAVSCYLVAVGMCDAREMGNVKI